MAGAFQKDAFQNNAFLVDLTAEFGGGQGTTSFRTRGLTPSQTLGARGHGSSTTPTRPGRSGGGTASRTRP